ncbi:MAG: transglycosylase SLT domain-containing protein [Candidatus Aenigmarchaeota archaeon]|nr:transglycosylase SLT domain-containing protein [Candidatus Aenigmarchaeota archaeon]
MKKLIVILALALLAAANTVAAQTFILDNADSVPASEEANINSIASGLYSSSPGSMVVLITLPGPLNNIDRVAEEQFFSYKLNEAATPELNFLIVHSVSDNRLRIAHAEQCGVGSPEIRQIIADSRLLFSKGEYKDGYFFLYAKLKDAINTKKEQGISCVLNIEKNDKCEVLIKNGPAEGKIDVTFVDDGYLEKFSAPKRETLLKMIGEGIFSSDILAKKRDAFNFYLSEPQVAVAGGSLCEDSPHGSCDFTGITKDLKCPADVVVILSDRKFNTNELGKKISLSYSQFADETLIRSFGSKNYPGINDIEELKLLLDGRVLLHELGHAAFGLADEYANTGILSSDNPRRPNCAPDRATAASWWGYLVGQGEGDLKVGYFDGCSFTEDNVKPTKNSVMNDHLLTDSFGPVNEVQIGNTILKYRLGIDEEGVAPPPKLIAVPPNVESVLAQYIPQQYVQVVYSASQEYGVQPELVAAIIQKESDWIPDRVSEKNAIGLMQLTPITKEDLMTGASSTFCRNAPIDDPFDPAKNVFAGTCYFAYWKRVFVDVELALAAYNSGPTFITGLLNDCEAQAAQACEWEDIITDMELSKQIPFETSNYVAVVNRNYQNYLSIGRPT